jgi:hypothetical protein
MSRREENGVLFNQVDIKEFEVAGDGKTFFGNLIDIDDHGFSRKNSPYYTISTSIVNSGLRPARRTALRRFDSTLPVQDNR